LLKSFEGSKAFVVAKAFLKISKDLSGILRVRIAD